MLVFAKSQDVQIDNRDFAAPTKFGNGPPTAKTVSSEINAYKKTWMILLVINLGYRCLSRHYYLTEWRCYSVRQSVCKVEALPAT